MDLHSIFLSLAGGILIGLSSTSMLGGLGRIAGISGILSGVLSRPSLDKLWKYSFLSGLVLGGFICQKLYPNLFKFHVSTSFFKMMVAGFLVGFGTRLGNGCTSGHGVCGIARMAKRSLVATVIFISTGIVTASMESLFL